MVELMVAVTLALIVTGGVVSVFIGARSAFQSTSGVAVVSDNGRFALGFIEGAVRNAGNMACGAPIRTIINVNAEATPLYYSAGPGPLLLFQPMSGFEAVGTGSGASYTASTASGVLGNWNPPSGNCCSEIARRKSTLGIGSGRLDSRNQIPSGRCGWSTRKGSRLGLFWI